MVPVRCRPPDERVDSVNGQLCVLRDLRGGRGVRRREGRGQGVGRGRGQVAGVDRETSVLITRCWVSV